VDRDRTSGEQDGLHPVRPDDFDYCNCLTSSSAFVALEVKRHSRPDCA
jgi:hypothetical protein